MSKTTVTGDAKQVVGILAWMQEAGLQASTVTVGACRVELHRTAAPAARETERPQRESIYGQFGGPALAHIVESGIPADEMQPVIGRAQ